MIMRWEAIKKSWSLARENFPNVKRLYVSIPEKFSFSATNVSSYPGTYSPYLIGQNDGVAGGDGFAKVRGARYGLPVD